MVQDLKKAPVTGLLLGLTLLMFLAMQLVYLGNATSSQAIFDFGGMYGRYVMSTPSNLWRLITPIFVHIGWEHVMMNSLTLYFVGRMAEQVWGSVRFLLLYLLSGIMGNLFTLLLTPDVVSAGASTSLFGLFAAFALVGYYGNNPYLKQIGKSYFILIALNLFFNLFMTNVGMVGHIGGAVGGALVAVILPLSHQSLFSKTWQSLAVLSYFALTLLVLCLVYMVN